MCEKSLGADRLHGAETGCAVGWNEASDDDDGNHEERDRNERHWVCWTNLKQLGTQELAQTIGGKEARR